MRYAKGLFVLMLFLLAGCAGTTHHFLPPRPLETKEAMLSLSWHYDFNQLYIVDIFPSMNVYAGVGSDINLGFGIVFGPLLLDGISHVSFAKYLHNKSNGYTILYSHINQPLGNIYVNPYIEAGAGISEFQKGTAYMYSVGLSYGHGMSSGLFPFSPRESAERIDMKAFTHIRRILPFARLTIGGTNAAFSASYYAGQTSLVYANIDNAIANHNDTILVVPSEKLISLSDPSDLNIPLNEETWGSFFIVRSDDTIWVYGGGFSEYVNIEELTTWGPLIHVLNDSLSNYSINGQKVILNTRELFNTWKAGNDLVIRRFPEDLSNRIKRRKSLMRDFSIAGALVTFEKEKSR